MALQLQQKTSSHNKYNSHFVVGADAEIQMHIKTGTSYVKQSFEYNAIIIDKMEDKPERYLSVCGCNVLDDV